MPSIDLTTLLITVAFMSALGLVLSIVLAIANRRLWVYEDPRIDELEELLPKSNCGACGTAGCRPFAEKLISGEMQPASCTVSSKESVALIADYLGVDAGNVVKRVARLACAGGNHVARMRAHYAGAQTCRGASIVGGGPKSCTWGCIGLGDCEDVCDYDAIAMDKHGLPVVNSERCTACGDCVDICPKDLFSLHPVTHHLWVACKNQLFEQEALDQCEVACTACERCARDAAPGLIEIRNNLATINYDRNDQAEPLVIDRCPTGAIVWLDDRLGTRKGLKARHIIREEALPF